MGDDQFLPCPFCGEVVSDSAIEGTTFVATCCSCISDNGWVLVKDWNNRPVESRHMAAMLDMKRMAEKYRDVYTEEHMPNTASAFQDFIDYIVSAVGDK